MNNIMSQDRKAPLLVRSAVERLEKIAAESTELSEKLGTTFSSVLYHQPREECGSPRPDNDIKDNDINGSDLGKKLTSIGAQIDRNLNEIRQIIESADL